MRVADRSTLPERWRSMPGYAAPWLAEDPPPDPSGFAAS